MLFGVFGRISAVFAREKQPVSAAGDIVADVGVIKLQRQHGLLSLLQQKFVLELCQSDGLGTFPVGFLHTQDPTAAYRGFEIDRDRCGAHDQLRDSEQLINGFIAALIQRVNMRGIPHAEVERNSRLRAQGRGLDGGGFRLCGRCFGRHAAPPQPQRQYGGERCAARSGAGDECFSPFFARRCTGPGG